MRNINTFFTIPAAVLIFIAGCKQTEDFTPSEIVEVNNRNPASFSPFSEASLYLKENAGTDPDSGIDIINLMGGRFISFYSFSLWFKMDSPSNSGTFLKTNTLSTVDFDLSWQAGTKTLSFYNLFRHMGLGVDVNLLSEISNPQAWNHIVVTLSYNGSDTNTVKLYHNGALSQEENIISDQIQWLPGRKLEILPNTNSISPAYIDEIAFWQRTLNASEIEELYGEGAPTNLSLTHNDVSAWWRFGETGFLPTIDDEMGPYKITLFGEVEISNDTPRPEPFGGENTSDPLSDDASGDGTTSGGGSDPLQGGSGGFGGEIGDGNSSGNFP